MRLALITVHYPPIKSSCAVQMKDLAHEFLNQGHNPVVITPDHELKESLIIQYKLSTRTVQTYVSYLDQFSQQFNIPSGNFIGISV